ncbi:MAG TPA: hypothetical protein VFB62_11710 [Polyangiaceae bacterium]|jgi:hypothetical protein|nr:hypothetical protein [Polyangiaceae bacterium]
MLARWAPLALLVLATACGEGQAASPQAPVVDERHGFELVSPGEGWTLLSADKAKLLHPDALAGATSRDITAVVMMERMPRVALERYAGRVADAIVLEERTIEQRESTRVGDADGWRISLSGKRGAVDLRFGVLVAQRGEYAYRLLAWGDKSVEAVDFTPVFEALSLRETAAMREEATPPRQGVDWRIHGRDFESVALGLRVKAPDGWRIAVEEGPDADVALVRGDLGISFTSEPCSGDPSAELQASFLQTLSAKVAERVDIVMLGTRNASPVFRDDGREYFHAVRVAEGRCHQALARYPTGERRAVLAALQSVALLPKERRAALERELTADKTRVVGADCAIQGGALRHFASGWRWRMPRGAWRISAGEAAQARNRDALAVVENRVLGIDALLIHDPKADAAAEKYHDSVVSGMSARSHFKEARRDKTTLAEAAALVSEGEAVVRGRPVALRAITSVRDGGAVQILVWARPENMKAQAEAIGRLLSGIAHDSGLRAVERTTTSYRDRRLGYELALSSEWRFDDRTPAALAPAGSFVRWDHHGRWLGVLALAGGEQDDFVFDLLEKLLRDDLGALARGDEHNEATTLAGWPARHLSWSALLQHVDAFVLHRDGVSYALVAVDSDGEGSQRLREGFAFTSEEP